MDLNDYQKLALRTSVRHYTIQSKLDNAVLGLCGESGELADYWKKHKYHNHELLPKRVIEELGDILWYISLAAEALGYDLEEVAFNNITKLHDRYPEGFSSERSIYREE
jgi:NTP pyrophosphatase (non-canonical NTP hydrolase)